MRKFSITVNGQAYQVEVEEIGAAPVYASAPAPVPVAPAPAPGACRCSCARPGARSGPAGCARSCAGCRARPGARCRRRTGQGPDARKYSRCMRVCRPVCEKGRRAAHSRGHEDGKRNPGCARRRNRGRRGQQGRHGQFRRRAAHDELSLWRLRVPASPFACAAAIAFPG